MTANCVNGKVNKFMMANSVISGPPTDEAVASLVGRIVSDLQSSMLNLHLQKAAQVLIVKYLFSIKEICSLMNSYFFE